MPSLKSLNLSIALCCLYITLRCDHDLWYRVTWTFAAYRLWRDETLYQISTQSSNPQPSYCDFSVWPYDLEFEHYVTCCARLWDNFHQVWPSTTYPCLNYRLAFLCWYVMSRCDLDLWPLDLIWAKSINWRLICWRFSTFHNAILGGGWGISAQRFSGWAPCMDPTSPNLAEAYRAIIHSFIHKNLFQQVEWCQISHFLTPTVKIKVGMNKISIPVVETYTHDRSSEIHLMAIHCVAAEHGGLVDW